MKPLATLLSMLLIPAFGRAADEAIDWHDIKSLGLEGQAFSDVKAPFDRLPGSTGESSGRGGCSRRVVKRARR